MRVDYKKITREFNDYVLKDDYKNKIRVELTGFEPVHRALPGRNSVSTLVELSTQVLEANRIHVEYNSKYNVVDLYVKSTCRYGHGFGSDTCIAIKLRDKKGKNSIVEIKSDGDKEENVRRLERILGNAPTLLEPEEYKKFWTTRISEIVDDALVKDAPTAYLANQFSRTFIEDLLSYGIRYAEIGSEKDKLTQLFALAQYKLVQIFEYDFKEYFVPQYVINKRNYIEFGWHTNLTYNSLPRTLKMSKVKGIKTVGLKELGVERPGYYSNDERMQVRPEQAKAAKKFASTFESKKNRTREQVLKGVY